MGAPYPSDGAPIKPRITQSDVARVAGVHNTTVSLSLRNSPAIPEATRKRIRELAEKMGYHPDPTLQALVAYRKGRVSNQPRETLAYITNCSTRWGWRALPEHEKAHDGAQRKAAELGYQLEHFWLGEPGMNPRRMSSMLFHRGITGALIAACGESTAALSDFDWSRLSAVKIGCPSHAPALHCVSDDYGGMARLATRRILAAGYERVGLVLPMWWDDIADQAWSGGFFAEQSRLPMEKRVPILRVGGSWREWRLAQVGPDCSSETDTFSKWYEAHRPDAIVGFSSTTLNEIERLGLVVPRDVAYVDLCLDRFDLSIAGVRHNPDVTGEVATGLLVGYLQQNLCGLPAVATATMVEGTWVEGASLPKVDAFKSGSDDGDSIDRSLLASA